MSIEFVGWLNTYYVGIDQSSYEASKLPGIRNVKGGIHLFTWSPTYPAGLISGVFAMVHEDMKYSIDFDSKSETASLQKLDVLYDENFYPFESTKDWDLLTKFITVQDLQRIFATEGEFFYLDTSTYVNADLVSQDPEFLKPSRDDKLLNFAEFNLRRSWSPSATGPERSKQAIDKSFLFQRLVQSVWNDNPISALAELSISFLSYSILSHYGALEHWKNMLSLLLQSYELAETEPEFYASFLELFKLQLSSLSESDLETSAIFEKGVLLSCLDSLSERKVDGSFGSLVNEAIENLLKTISELLNSHEEQAGLMQKGDLYSAADYEAEVHETGDYVIDVSTEEDPIH
ncbi:A1 cistron-splicing factor aar2 [Schizosaccharomyces pombe]